MARNPANDVRIYISDIELELEFYYDLNYIVIDSEETTLELDFTYNLYNYSLYSLDASLNISASSDVYIQYIKNNFVMWSKIGELDFTQDNTNIAGETVMEWKGDIWHIGKLDSNIIVYGSGGISILIPSGVNFGRRLLLNLGIKNQGAVLITPEFHMFIDSKGDLWKLTPDKLTNLGYKHVLSSMNSSIISHDAINNLAYICDGVDGYVYNIETSSMCSGPFNITGIGYYNGTSYIIASNQLTSPDHYLSTSTFDFHNRNFKTIIGADIGVEFTGNLELGISYRNAVTGNFSSPVWFTVTPEGRSFTNIFGKEFKFHLSGDDIRNLHYIKVKGMFADFNPIDTE